MRDKNYLERFNVNNAYFHSITGAYIAKHSHDGEILAVAVNQKLSKDSRIIFYSLATKGCVITDLYGCSRHDGRGK